MAKGFLGGIVAGGLVSGVVVGAASLLTDIPGYTPPQAPAVADQPAEAPTETPTETPPAQGAPLTAPKAEEGAPLSEEVTSPPEEPAALTDTPDPQSAPEGEAEAPAPQVETPVYPNPQAMAPEAPAAEDLSITTEPAQPTAPPAEDTPFGTQDAATAPLVDPEATGAPLIDPEAQAAPLVDTDTTRPEPLVDTDIATAPLTDPASESEAMTEAPDTPLDASPAAEESEMQMAAVAPEGLRDSAPTGPSSTIGNLATGVTTNRLPSITTGDTEPTPTAQPASDLPPLKAFAEPFDNPEGKPLMSIILLDNGTSPITLDALQTFPYPLTFAVDASWSGAGAAMQRYRDAGFEVMAMVDLPAQLTASDAEVAMQSYLANLPEAVAVMEGDRLGLQANRAISDQVTAIARDEGLGLVMFPNGLDTAVKLAVKEGVPAATVFRDFDANGQDATVIRRFLDQAAFKAGQEAGGVIMLGRLRPDTISALLIWGLQDRAARVALAPVSALLTATQE